MNLKDTFLGKKLKMVENGRQVLEMPNSVNFLFWTGDNKIVVAKQYRASTRTETLNAFGGYIDPGETPIDAIVREGAEESNIYIPEEYIDVIFEGKLVSAGYTTERNTSALVRLPGKFDDYVWNCNDVGEGIEIVAFDIDEFLTLEFNAMKIHFLQQHIFLSTYITRRAYETN